jgi:FHS family glucose/mannose:H+ symporter-like MFS transporter
MRHRLIIPALVLSYMLFGAMLNCVGAINLLAIQTMGVSALEAATLDAYKDLPIAVMSFLVAANLPRYGLRRSMALALLAVAVVCAALPSLASFWSIKLFFVVLGAAFAVIKVSTYASIGLVTRTARTHAGLTSLIEGLFMIGVMSGYWAFSGMADDRVGAGPAWLNIFWGFAALALISAALMSVATLDESEGQKKSEVAQHNTGLASSIWGMVGLLRVSVVAIFVAAAFLYVLIEQGVGTWLPTFNNQVLQLSTSMSVGLAVIMPAATALGRLLGAGLMARWGWFRIVQCCLVGVAAVIGATLLLPAGAVDARQATWWNAPLAAYLLPMLGLFLAPIYPAINSAILSKLPQSDHAAMTGLIVIFSALGGSLGSLLIGTLFGLFDGRIAFLCLLLPLLLLALALRRFSRQLAAHQHSPA